MERKFITHSQLGIDYTELMPEYLAEIFLHSEHEWLSNAHVMYWSDAGEIWAEDIFPRLVSNTLEDHDLEDVSAYLPKMLHMFAAVDIAEPKLRHLTELAVRLLQRH